ncbi:MAG TPA: cation diffusion facilitator family transporter [Taishania sp.]|nr:cation diffusion facilitator family transporter [Taishania sp.]HNS41602.1 cation diffusion facilitator family transporter [Taishania sp.]
MKNNEIAVKTAYFSIFSNFCLALIKGVAGFFGNSYALIADAIESTTDVFSSILVLLGIRYSSRPADENHPYGHGKIEPLLTFVIVGFLITSAVVIAYESCKNIFTPHALPKSWTLYVLGAIIVWKEASYHIVLHKSKQINSTVLKADAWHHRSDAITSIAAFIGISIALFFGKGYEAADDWAALLASVFILYNSYRIFRPALSEIMDENTYEDIIKQVRAVATTVDGVIDTEKCYVRKSGVYYYIDLHATVDGNATVKKGHDISHRLKDALQSNLPFVKDVLIHIEPHDIGEEVNLD